ncbi:right-handed parallel beta-helix repeat-containing protein [Paenibacillus ginsengarvi]|uniref:Uncharacterized protein n=1 Tax=Paenibacillus ginsengarvi TaxID=400777 RepID=A0A3B0BCC3_9BACL|nr:right-handed parallel beta-helix repeat-containing protein [Paenibacillus ginsengarvi]RKN70089.1 hypothetical protein D7M11_31180 [Paenibacillus ginsengarvi]
MDNEELISEKLNLHGKWSRRDLLAAIGVGGVTFAATGGVTQAFGQANSAASVTSATYGKSSGNPHDQIGDLSSLRTAEKSNLVGAINETHSNLEAITAPSVVDSITELTAFEASDKQIVIVKAFYEGSKVGGGKFMFALGDTAAPDNVYRFAGDGGIWYRLNWKDPDIFDAGIRADGTDETLKFKALLKAAAYYFGSATISLRGKSIKLTDFEHPSNITLYNGGLDFSESTAILADNKIYNAFIIGGNRTGRTSDPGGQVAYAALDELRNIGYIRIAFKTPPAGTYNFSTDIMYFHKLKGFKLVNCDGEGINSNRICTIVGGPSGTVTSNDIPLFDLIDPVNGRSSDIVIKDNSFDAGKAFGFNAAGQRLIVPSMRLTACENIDISGNRFKNFNFGALVDAYSRNGAIYNNTVSIDDDVLDVWLSTASRTDQGGIYAGQSAYHMDVYNNTIHNFVNKGIYLEGVSYANIYGNRITYSPYAKSLTIPIFQGINLQPNIRQHPYTSVAGVQAVHVFDNFIDEAKSPFLMSSGISYSLKDIHVHDNQFRSKNGLPSMQVTRCFDSAFSNNDCWGGLLVGEADNCSFIGNNFNTPSNFALYLTGAEKVNLRFEGNAFVANAGQAIYNGTASTALVELFGGKIQAKDGTSAALRNGSGAGKVRAYEFVNGVTEMRQTISQAVNLAAGARTVITQAIPGLKVGWLAEAKLGSLGTFWTSSSIDLTLKAGVRAGEVDILVRNEGAASVNFTPTFLLEYKSHLSNVYTN